MAEGGSALNIRNHLLLSYVFRAPRFHTTFYTTFFFGVPYPLGSLSNQSQLSLPVPSDWGLDQSPASSGIAPGGRALHSRCLMHHASRTTAHCPGARARDSLAKLQ